MMFRFLILIFFLTTTQPFVSANGNKNIQIFSYISKQTDCGLIEIDEFTESQGAILYNFNEDSNIDNDVQNGIFEKQIANLSSCLNDDNSKYSSYSTYMSSNVAQTIFNEYFHIDKIQGTLFLTKPIDREKLCLQSEALERIKLKKKRSLLYNNNFSDAINCDCKSEVCELRFKFVAFPKRKPNRTSRNKAPGLFSYQYNHQRHKNNRHKTIIITIAVKDLNDNSPEFKQNYYFLNFSEQIGKSPLKSSHQDSNISPLCPLSSEITDFEQFQKALIPLERAIDLDSGKNSEISYTLILFQNKNPKFVEEIKSESDTSNRENLIKSALENQIENCNDQFELIQTKPTNREFTFDNENKIYDFEISSANSHIHRPLLFLKVNTFFDREQRDVYNFIIFADDKKKQNKFSSTQFNKTNKDFNHLIKGNNYMLIRLAITDLNDNSPVFSQVKYNFELNEIVSYPLNEDHDYYDRLNSTCSVLKNKLKVEATDKDSDQNGLIRFKLVQQVHRKNSNFKSNRNEIMQSIQPLELELDSNSFFSIDQSDGSVSLKVCKQISSGRRFEITKKKFMELTSLLDYELYTKHILVVEASDASVYNSLQTFVTLELKLNDLNDNSPYFVNFFTKSCSSKIGSLVEETSKKSNFGKKDTNITIESFEHRPKMNKNLTANVKFISSRIIITNLSESSTIGTCIGKFFIKDLDSLERNRKIEAILFENKERLLINSTLQINPLAQLAKTSKILFKSLRNNDRKQRHLNETILDEDHNEEQASTQEIFEMFLNYQFDAEKSVNHEFLILLRDSGQDVSFESYTHLKIILKDENDKIPQFEKAYYQFSMFEWFGHKDGLNAKSQQNGMSKYCLEKIKVTDEDITNENSEIHYELNELNEDDYSKTHGSRRNTRFKYNAMDLFTVNHTTGTICVRNDSFDRLDREIKASYKFYLTAINKLSEMPLKSSVIVEIILKDLNDNQPEFSLNKYHFFIPEKDSNLVNSLVLGSESQKKTKILYYVGKVKALDKDIGFNSQLKYYLHPKSIDYECKSYYELNTKNKKNPFMGLDKIPLSEVYIETKNGFKKTPRFFKLIHNINNVVHINETNGDIYLLQQFDRELITHIYFTVFVSDRLGSKKLGGESALSNSVPVVIEFIDINDSKPQCNNVELKHEHDNSYRREKSFVFSVYMDLSVLTMNTLISSYPIYKLDCLDLDQGKNAELTYEIEKIYLKRIEDNKFENDKMIFSLNDFIDSLSLNQKKILGEFDQTNDHDSSKKTNYIKNSQLFSIDRKAGLVYFNYVQELWQSSSFYSSLFFQNYFLVLRIKVSDKGIITSQNSFMLKLRFCFRNSLHGSSVSISKYCDYNYYETEINKTKDSNNNFVIQKLENLEEELKVYDYPMDGLSQQNEMNHYDESLDYIPDSNELDEYDSNVDPNFFNNNLRIIKSENLNRTNEKFSTLFGTQNAAYSMNSFELIMILINVLISYLCSVL